jgi:CDP-diglyceride synthetase
LVIARFFAPPPRYPTGPEPATGREIWHDQTVYPSTHPETGRDARTTGNRPEPPGPPPAPRGVGGQREDPGPDVADEVSEEVVPVRRLLSVATGGFAALVGVGLVFGAQTSGPGARLPFAVVVVGVQLLYILAWTMALRPPALPVVAVTAVAAAGVIDTLAIRAESPGLTPAGYVALAGTAVGVIAQLIRPEHRSRVVESFGSTLLIMFGVAAFGGLITLSRLPIGTQTIFVALTATALALSCARLIDAVFPRPRLAPQVPRGATGVVVGAMLGTLIGAVIGSYVVGFTPTAGAVVGVLAGTTAVLTDLAVGYSEAGRQMAGDAPTMWVARHMQGPLGGFALAAAAGYACSWFLI